LKAQLLAHSAYAVSFREDPDKPVIPADVQLCKMLVMTSYENHDATIAHFEEHAYFGAKKENFLFFQQNMLPAVSFDGKIMMQSPFAIKLAPNGNGALFEAIQQRADVQDVIKSMSYVQVIGVDNAINKVLDPLFIGYASENQLQCALKTVEKEQETEKVGVVLIKDGKYDIAEYSEVPDEIRDERLPSNERASYFYTPPPGPLVYRHGHILHVCVDAKFLLDITMSSSQSVASMYHKATKKIEAFDLASKELVAPEVENGYKFELFFHGFLPRVETGKLGVMSVDRATEFAPVKNADVDGEVVADSPAMSRDMILKEATEWLDQVPDVQIAAAARDQVEVSFLLSYRGESLLDDEIAPKIAEQQIDAPGYINHLGDFIRL